MATTDKITIMDIARLTGLSKGTVDRVIHNRGEVSKKSYDKIMAVIKELGYEPNFYASLLAKGTNHTIVVLIPNHMPGTFWELSDHGIQRAAATVKPLGVHVQVMGYEELEEDSFRSACSSILEMAPSGVVFAPMFKTESMVFANALAEKGIPYTFIDSKIEDEGYMAYYGMPMYESGYLCGDQLTGGNPVESVLIVRIHRDRNSLSDPTLIRREGFLDYLKEHSPQCNVHNLFIDPSAPEEIYSVLEDFFKEHPQVHHLVMFNSRVHLLAPYLREHPEHGRKVVGFDNLSANLSALLDGTVSTLIAQHPDEQVNLAVTAISDKILLGKYPERKDNFMHMDILTRYNAAYY